MGGRLIPGATSRKLILYQTTNTCIPLRVPATPRKAGGGGCSAEMPSQLRHSLNLYRQILFYSLTLL